MRLGLLKEVRGRKKVRNVGFHLFQVHLEKVKVVFDNFQIASLEFSSDNVELHNHPINRLIHHPLKFFFPRLYDLLKVNPMQLPLQLSYFKLHLVFIRADLLKELSDRHCLMLIFTTIGEKTLGTDVFFTLETEELSDEVMGRTGRSPFEALVLLEGLLKG
jgi:hypothetical protein